MKLLNRKAISPKMMGAAVILVGLLVGGGAFFVVGQAFADSPRAVPMNVTWYGTATITEGSPVYYATGGYTVIPIPTDTITVTGDASGTDACSGTLVINSNGAFEFRATCTFTGTVKGGNGVGTMSWNFWGDGTGPISNTAIYQGGNTWSQGTDGLRGIQGDGTYEGYFTGATTGVATGVDQVTFSK